MNKSLVCRCGAVMVSDGQEFHCPHYRQKNPTGMGEHDPAVPDIRLGLFRPDPDAVGTALKSEARHPLRRLHGLIASGTITVGRKPRLKAKIHKGPMRLCGPCNRTEEISERPGRHARNTRWSRPAPAGRAARAGR